MRMEMEKLREVTRSVVYRNPSWTPCFTELSFPSE